MDTAEESFATYKEFHEHFMLNHNGTSLWECSIFITLTPSSLLLWSVTLPMIRGIYGKKSHNVSVFTTEFIILVLPLVFTCTVLSDHIPVVSLSMIIVWAILAILNARRVVNRTTVESWLESAVGGKHKPFITLFRSYTNVITCLCILAVDFRVFPRKFAKTEVSGYGLMDTGTGLFVLANALVSHNPRVDKDISSLTRTIKSSTPLLLLGVIRCLAIGLSNYQTHVSEYGSHWNFFLTLAVTRVLGEILSTPFRRGSLMGPGVQFVAIACLHEWALSSLGLREWVISDRTPRHSFVSANREGLVSLTGYLALHSAGRFVSLRIWGIPRREIRSWLRLWLELILASLVAWGVTHFLHGITGVSRRVADLGYISWMLACSLSGLALFLGVELTISALHHYYGSFWWPRTEGHGGVSDGERRGKHKEGNDYDNFVPVLLQAVNYNGLAYFLLANLVTGMVNLSMRTLHVGAAPSIVILTLYMMFLCAVVKILYDREIKVKLW